MADKKILTVPSSDIKVFPTTKRSDAYDRNARFPSELNLTSLVNRLTSRTSFVISGLEVSADFTLSNGSCNINGYYFVVAADNSVKGVSIADLSPVKDDLLCLSAEFRTTDVSTADGSSLTFMELVGYDTAGSNSKYTGLSITTEKPDVINNPNNNPYQKGQIFYLPVAKYDGTVWVNIDNAQLKYVADDMLVDVREGLVEIDTRAERSSHIGEQSLQQWLDAFIIDDGEI